MVTCSTPISQVLVLTVRAFCQETNRFDQIQALHQAPMDDSPLKKLSPELRNHIYELTLPLDGVFKIQEVKQFDGWRTKVRFQASSDQRHRFALNQVCKEIRQECTPMLYGRNRFEIRYSCGDCKTPEKVVQEFYHNIGPDVASWLRKINIDLKEFDWFWDQENASILLDWLMEINALAVKIPQCVIEAAIDLSGLHGRVLFEHARMQTISLNMQDLTSALLGLESRIDALQVGIVVEDRIKQVIRRVRFYRSVFTTE